MWGFSDICAYDWSGWKGSLLQTISPRARRILAKIGETPERLASRLPRRTRLLVVHLDISDNEPFIANAAEFARSVSQHGVTVLNCLEADIRKRTVQACCKRFGLPSVTATPEGDADELVIVKTDLNSGGTREKQLSADQGVRVEVATRQGLVNGPSDYFVKKRADIGAEVWSDPELVVERYMTNPLGRFFRVYVAGNAIVISEAFDKIQVKRMGGDIRRHNYSLWREGESLRGHSGSNPDLPPALLSTAAIFIHRFKLDYGALDIVESENSEFHVVDVNKTPYWGNERQPGLIEHLRLGLAA